MIGTAVGLTSRRHAVIVARLAQRSGLAAELVGVAAARWCVLRFPVAESSTRPHYSGQRGSALATPKAWIETAAMTEPERWALLDHRAISRHGAREQHG